MCNVGDAVIDDVQLINQLKLKVCVLYQKRILIKILFQFIAFLCYQRVGLSITKESLNNLMKYIQVFCYYVVLKITLYTQ